MNYNYLYFYSYINIQLLHSELKRKTTLKEFDLPFRYKYAFVWNETFAFCSKFFSEKVVWNLKNTRFCCSVLKLFLSNCQTCSRKPLQLTTCFKKYVINMFRCPRKFAHPQKKFGPPVQIS